MEKLGSPNRKQVQDEGLKSFKEDGREETRTPIMPQTLTNQSIEEEKKKKKKKENADRDQVQLQEQSGVSPAQEAIVKCKLLRFCAAARSDL